MVRAGLMKDNLQYKTIGESPPMWLRSSTLQRSTNLEFRWAELEMMLYQRWHIDLRVLQVNADVKMTLLPQMGTRRWKIWIRSLAGSLWKGRPAFYNCSILTTQVSANRMSKPAAVSKDSISTLRLTRAMELLDAAIKLGRITVRCGNTHHSTYYSLPCRCKGILGSEHDIQHPS